jgi:hypothetical protein
VATSPAQFPELPAAAAIELAAQLDDGLVNPQRLAAVGIPYAVADEIARALRHAAPKTIIHNSEDVLLEYGIAPRLARAIVDAVDVRRRQAA